MQDELVRMATSSTSHEDPTVACLTMLLLAQDESGSREDRRAARGGAAGRVLSPDRRRANAAQKRCHTNS